jgi:hypothetical protein
MLEHPCEKTGTAGSRCWQARGSLACLYDSPRGP